MAYSSQSCLKWVHNHDQEPDFRGMICCKIKPGTVANLTKRLVVQPRLANLKIFSAVRRGFHWSFCGHQIHTVQSGGSLKPVGLFREARAGIGVYVGPNDPSNIALPIVDVSSFTSQVEIKEKAIMLGILVGIKKCGQNNDTVLVLSDCEEAVERLGEKFASPQLEIRHVARKYVSKATRLARKACKMDRNIFDDAPDF